MQPVYSYDEYRQQLKNIEVEQQEAFERELKDQREEKERRERLRIARLGASGKTPLIYSIDRIIELCQLNEKKEFLQIDFLSLGFEDSHDSLFTRVIPLFTKLKELGGFKTLERINNSWFHVTGWDLRKLRNFRNKIKEEEGDEALVIFKKTSRCPRIKTIKYIYGNTFVVNDSWTHTIKGKETADLCQELWKKRLKKKQKRLSNGAEEEEAGVYLRVLAKNLNKKEGTVDKMIKRLEKTLQNSGLTIIIKSSHARRILIVQ